MRFSQKIGKTGVRDSIQIESIDEKLENRLWNIILQDFFYKLGADPEYSLYIKSDMGQIFLFIWQDFFGNRIDEIPGWHNEQISVSKNINFIKDWFFESKWFEKYDFLEFLSKIVSEYYDIEFIEICNNCLKREMSAYRIVDACIVQITSEEEIVEIEDALLNSSIWEPVNIHLKTAIEYFSNRENPNYRNSVKESISAVESLCKIIVGIDNTTLGPALKIIEKKHELHGALKSAFTALYGYTSEAGGIRHALLSDDIEVSMEDAKFMLVSCSAFINYLKVKIEK
nr:hypothetical protein [uncultured Flavobacterium sp.]